MIIDGKEWFAENQWYLKAIENGEEVEFSNYSDWRESKTGVPDGFDLSVMRPYSFGLHFAYRYARPIPKKKMRMKTREEAITFCIDHPRILVRGCFKYWEPWSRFNLDAPENYEYIEIPEGYHGDFSDLEVKKFETEVKE